MTSTTVSHCLGRSFNLTVVEQPHNCRASGFSNTDRRPINPTPIVRLLKYDCVSPPSRTSNTSTAEYPPSSSSAIGVIMELSEPTVIAQPSSSGSNIQMPTTAHTPPENTERVLLGPLVCSGSAYRGLDQQRGIYFSFPDLSIRLSGSYRLHFNLMLLGSRSETVIADVYSDPFTVYTAKTFPGMEGSLSS
ncbi:velvet factor [Fennellomyces sp. T-0311]|nr:velvet factor [Fennellomyces sp. T-0311]